MYVVPDALGAGFRPPLSRPVVGDLAAEAAVDFLAGFLVAELLVVELLVAELLVEALLVDVLVEGRFALPVSAETGSVLAVFRLVVVLPTGDEAEVDVVLPTVSCAVAGARRAAWLAVERAGLAAAGGAEASVLAPGGARRTFAVEDAGARRVA